MIWICPSLIYNIQEDSSSQLAHSSTVTIHVKHYHELYNFCNKEISALALGRIKLHNELLFWQPSGIFLYSTVIIFICFMLCWRIKYDDDEDDDGLISNADNKRTNSYINIVQRRRQKQNLC